MTSIRPFHTQPAAIRLKPVGFVRGTLFGFGAIVLAGSWGCSSNSDHHATAGSGGGTAGSGGKAGGSSVVAGSGAVAEPVPCGSTQCTVPANPLTSLIPGGGAALPGGASVACCVDSTKGTCGTAAMAGATCEPPAVADPRCPGLNLGALGGLGAMFGVGGAAMSGCCVDNMCGLDGSLLGRGCVENSSAMTQLSAIPGIGALIMFPPALACDRPQDTDAGAEDAGL